jgi:hypothetical protein
VLLVAAPTYEFGAQLRFNGGGASVLEDKGDVVLLSIPPARFRTRAGDHLSLAASRIEVGKADLVIENLEGEFTP